MSMPGKQARVLCPVCAEPMPPDETECANCGAFVIDEAVVRLSRAFELEECEICGTVLRGTKEPSPVAPQASPAIPQATTPRPVRRVLDKVDEFLRDLRPLVSHLPRPDAPWPAAASRPSEAMVKTPVPLPKPAPASPANKLGRRTGVFTIDRKSTRLNSSHDQMSYAVFCLKKKRP